MLVLSRKPGDTIVFPGLDISITVSDLRQSSVTLGVNAPREIRVLRGELATAADRLERSVGTNRQLSHAVRNHLNAASLALHALQVQMMQNKPCDPDLLAQAIEELEQVDQAASDNASLATTARVQRADHSQSTTATDPGTRGLALLVEDNENEAVLLSHLLQNEGFEVIVALDGLAAMNVLEQSESLPNIILLDMNMPGMDGVDFIRLMRKSENWNSIPVIAVTGLSPDAVAIPKRDLQIDHWFQKPVRSEQLIRRIYDSMVSVQ